jgi:dTDP-4-amino-4,6-dideoxygalactose transaminase
MNEIKFNIPLQINESLTNVKNFLNSKSPAHGPGKNISSIQKEVSKKFKFKDVFLTNSCTSALEICALAIDLKSDDEVIVPSFAFITTASSFARTGCKLKFCDIQKNNLMPSFKDIKTCVSKRTKAIVLVHYQGYSINYLNELKKFCKKKNIFLIEDAAQAFGSYLKKKPLGSFGDFACFSFHETKNIHSGSGGMLVVNNKKFLKKVRFIFDKGTNRFLMNSKKIKYYSWVTIGSAFLMTELTASYLKPQIEKINIINLTRSKLYNRYLEQLNKISKNNFFIPKNLDSKYNFHSFVLILEKDVREKFLKFLKRLKINAVISYTPLHKSNAGKKFFGKKKKLRNTDVYIKRVVRLPFHNSLSYNQIDYICEKIKVFFKR